MTRVFVSSTCYDLIDVRAEIWTLISELGLEPVMSDQPQSAFDIEDGQNSIELCLTNLRTSDIALFVFSQRYGPTLEAFGHPGVSATELEYREAQQIGKRRLVYCRNRLVADYETWRRMDPESRATHKFRWVGNDKKLLELLDRHQDHENPTNWYWTFTSSVDLKSRIAADLRRSVSSSILGAMQRQGLLPTLRCEAHFGGAGHDRVNTWRITIANVGTVPAVNFFVRRADGWTDGPVGRGHHPILIRPLEQARTEVRIRCKQSERPQLEFEFESLDGHRVLETHELDDEWSRMTVVDRRLATEK